MPLIRTRKWLAEEIARVDMAIREIRGERKAFGGVVATVRKQRLEKRLESLKAEFLHKNPHRKRRLFGLLSPKIRRLRRR